MTPIRSPKTCTARSRKSDVEKGTFMASDLSADSSTHQCRQDVTDRVAEDSVSNAVVRRRFRIDDHETGTGLDRDLAQPGGRLDRQRRADGQEEGAGLRGPPGGLQHVPGQRLTEGDPRRLQDAAAERAGRVRLLVAYPPALVGRRRAHA